ncbi:MAG: putative chaperone of endosialidase [Prokaryotic dsDNA virus sp.]|jgi:hypothetical protein|nr:MAG: putative chaperone of endosialidase [Prokaryotic dsDNA virus sp.]|tara:strand:+ start:68301 stop:70469 length:2169 start_codon:yes stop_codon:yes gene_type:complete
MTLRLGGDGAITGCTSLENPDLTVSGLTISGSFDAEKVLVSSGTAAAPSYTFSGDTDNGLYYAGTNSIGLSTAGSNAILIDSAGNVGVGNTSPGYKLSVLTTGTTDTSLHLATTGGASANGDATNSVRFTGGTNTRWANAKYEAFNHIFHANGVEKMRLDSSGALLVGTTSKPDVGATKSVQVVNTSTATLSLGRDDATISAGNDIGAIRFWGNAGSSYQQCAEILAEADGTHANNDKPSRLVFSTTADGGSSPTERLRIDSAGRVGIGTTTAESDLHVKKASAGSSAIRIQRNGSASSNGDEYGALLFEGTSYSGAKISSHRDHGTWDDRGDLRFSTGYGNEVFTERMRIDNTGVVRIGGTDTYNGSDKLTLVNNSGNCSLTIDSTSSGESSIFLADGTSGTEAYRGYLQYKHNTDALCFGTSGNEGMRLHYNGTLSIGKSTSSDPNRYVQIHNAGAASSAYFQSTNTGTGSGASDGIVMGMGSGTDAYFWNYEGGFIAMATYGTERVRITANGFHKRTCTNDYYGVTSNYHEDRQSTANWTTCVTNTHQTSPYGVLIAYPNSAPNNTTNQFLYCADSSALRATIYANGGLVNYQSNNGNLCDEREKKNIVSSNSKWNAVKQWNIKEFHYNEDTDSDDKRLGVIAQEVEQASPELIVDWVKQRAEEAELDEDGIVVKPAKEEILRKGVKEQQMMWMAIKALQEAQDRIETLEAEVAILKNK